MALLLRPDMKRDQPPVSELPHGRAAGRSDHADAGASLDRLFAEPLESPDEPRNLEDMVTRVFEQLRSPLYCYLMTSGADAAHAEDLTQEAFLRLYLHVRAGHPVENVRAWIFRVGHNLLVDAWRKRPRLVTPGRSEKEEGRAEPIDALPNPEDRLVRQERMDRLAYAISRLTVKQRQSLHLRAEGLTYREIADILGVSLWTVVDAVRRSVEKLAGIWGDRGE